MSGEASVQIIKLTARAEAELRAKWFAPRPDALPSGVIILEEDEQYVPCRVPRFGVAGGILIHGVIDKTPKRRRPSWSRRLGMLLASMAGLLAVALALAYSVQKMIGGCIL
jgi:hypothetical protein